MHHTPRHNRILSAITCTALVVLLLLSTAALAHGAHVHHDHDHDESHCALCLYLETAIQTLRIHLGASPLPSVVTICVIWMAVVLSHTTFQVPLSNLVLQKIRLNN